MEWAPRERRFRLVDLGEPRTEADFLLIFFFFSLPFLSLSVSLYRNFVFLDHSSWSCTGLPHNRPSHLAVSVRSVMFPRVFTFF